MSNNLTRDGEGAPRFSRRRGLVAAASLASLPALEAVYQAASRGAGLVDALGKAYDARVALATEGEAPKGIVTDSRLLPPSDTLRPRPLRDIAFYKNYDDVLGGNRKDGPPLVEMNYGLNAESDNVNGLRNWEGTLWTVSVFQGHLADVPMIGSAHGEGHQSVVVSFMNLDRDTVSWDEKGLGPLRLRRGFMAKASIVDGKNREETEERWYGHWVAKQFINPDYRGITGQPEQADSVLGISVVRAGGNWRLLRAEKIDRPAGV